MKKQKGSEVLKDFLDYISESDKKYVYAHDKMKEQDKLTSDILHKLELEDILAKERNFLARKLQENRKDRRYYKDIVEETCPIVDFMNNPSNKKTLEMIKQLLGEIRKVERYHENRTYTPKCEK